MPATPADSAIRSLTEHFVAQLTAAVREATLEAMHQALGGTVASSRAGRPTTAAKPTGRKPGRPARKATGKRVRRSSSDVDAMAAGILAHVQANPGSGAIEIAAALGVATKDLALPIKSLLADGKLRTEGRRRGTRYFAGGGGGSKPKTTRKKAKRGKAGKKKASRKQGRKKAAKRKTASRRAVLVPREAPTNTAAPTAPEPELVA